MPVRSPLDVLAIVLGLLLLVIIVVVGAICRPCLSRSSFWLQLFRLRDDNASLTRVHWVEPMSPRSLF
jgi:hypothetical protein